MHTGHNEGMKLQKLLKEAMKTEKNQMVKGETKQTNARAVSQNVNVKKRLILL